MNAPVSIKAALSLVAAGLLAALLVVGIALLTADPVTGPAQSRTETQAVLGRSRDGTAGRPPRARAHARARVETKPGEPVGRSPEPSAGHAPQPPGGDGGQLLEVIALALLGGTAAGLVGAGGLVAYVTRRRIRARVARVYERYEIRLSAHDETKPEDLEETVEALIGVVRETLDRRWKDGQPFFAVELHYGPVGDGMEWTVCLVCEPRVVKQLDGVLIAAYPDVRVGYEFVADPQPIGGILREPRFIERFRKKRMFVYALGRSESTSGNGRPAGAPLMELLAQAQVSAGAPSTIRMTFTPTVHAVERLASGLLVAMENRSARQERMGLADAGLRSEQRRAELRGAQRTQHRSLCWFELAVASDDEAACKAVGSALQTLRGENRLHRRTTDLTPKRTRRRFAACQPPLLPLVWFNWLAPPTSIVLGLRTLVSSSEIARLVELPTARLRTVPVRRLMLPRLPAPPEVMRATDTAPLELPPAKHEDDFDESAFEPDDAAEAADVAVDREDVAVP